METSAFVIFLRSILHVFSFNLSPIRSDTDKVFFFLELFPTTPTVWQTDHHRGKDNSTQRAQKKQHFKLAKCWTDCSSCCVTLLVQPLGNKSVSIHTVITCKGGLMSLVVHAKSFLSAAEVTPSTEIHETVLITHPKFICVSLLRMNTVILRRIKPNKSGNRLQVDTVLHFYVNFEYSLFRLILSKTH